MFLKSKLLSRSPKIVYGRLIHEANQIPLCSLLVFEANLCGDERMSVSSSAGIETF